MSLNTIQLQDFIVGELYKETLQPVSRRNVGRLGRRRQSSAPAAPTAPSKTASPQQAATPPQANLPQANQPPA